MPTDLQFRLLGPLAVTRGSVALPLARGKQRALLAALLLRHGQVVSVADLAEALWGADPPRSARVTVQNNVMRLRDALGEGGRLISTQPGGYTITIGADQLDVSQFEALIAGASAAARASAWADAASQAARALQLWRGTPLTDVDAELLQAREVPRLQDLRLQALETRIDADLHLGRPDEVIGELRRLVAAEPLRERLHGLLMRALQATGQRAAALASYQQAREILVAELGAEPGPALQELHQQILGGKPALARQPAVGGPGDGSGHAPLPRVPRELPPDVAGFTGRAAECAALDEILLGAAGASGDGTGTATAAVISAISGTAGVGKTALAVHWAHRAARHFPDGQLHVNLRGYDPGQPVSAADALARFLRSLGVPGPDIPPDEAGRAARYRSLLAGKRMLIVLDNAASVEQVRPLLPGHAGCRVLVTSRDSLAGLVARDGARRLNLDLLPMSDAVALLRDLIGQTAAADPAAVTELANQCARLPLALRVAAELAVARPATPLEGLLSELSDEQRRLELLVADGDPRSAVRAVFSWSYDHLDDRAARAFRLAGLHPGADLDAFALAALTGSTPDQARRALDTLSRAHLIQATGPERYALHDLLRAYARELAAARDREPETRAALDRLFGHYLATAAAAMDILHPAERDRRPRISASAALVAPISDSAAALSWLDRERATLVALAGELADRGGAHRDVHALATVLYRYFDNGAYLSDLLAVSGHALRAARRAGDRPAAAEALHGLAAAESQQGQYEAAARHNSQALAIFAEIDDRVGQARMLDALAIISVAQGRYQQAADYDLRALALFREGGYAAGEAAALGNLGRVAGRLGRYEEAAGYQRQALALARRLGNQQHESMALGRLGVLCLSQGRPDEALDYLQQALTLFRALGNRTTAAETLSKIGGVYLRQGRVREAIEYLTQATAEFRQMGQPPHEAEAANGLGEALFADGRPAEARAVHAEALALLGADGDKYQVARAHQGLGRCCQASADGRGADRHWREALAIFAEIGAPDADEVRGQLAALHAAESASPTTIAT